ncbi:unnamed protein product [Amoebophrya sp. A25]|nr:unnamed protein product [Amoebophrya sp. A25]|eukprot:GSA25T00024218001.1
MSNTTSTKRRSARMLRPVLSFLLCTPSCLFVVGLSPRPNNKAHRDGSGEDAGARVAKKGSKGKDKEQGASSSVVVAATTPSSTSSSHGFVSQALHSAMSEKKEASSTEDGDHPFTVTTDPNGAAPQWVNNPLSEYFFKYTSGLRIWKWHHYFAVYHRHFDSLRQYTKQQPAGSPAGRINMLVMGVQSGGEVGMWQNYFGDNFYYYGVDINPACKSIEKRYPRTKIYIGDQGDSSFLLSVKDEIAASGAPLHIVLDDGSHIAWHQIASFETLFPFLHIYGGVYITEDVTTNYAAANSVHRQPAPQLANFPAVSSTSETFIDHMKTRVDFVNGYWKFATANAGVNPWNDPFVTSVNDIAFYDGMVVIEKQPHQHPTQERRGSEDIPYCTNGQGNGCLT